MKAQKYILLAAFVVLWLCTKAQNITKVEYFIDSDPGYGLATNIAVTPAPVLINVSAAIDISSIVPGLHYLFVRARDDSSAWSISSTLTFYKESMAVDPVNITKLEYFIDNDPGFGQASNIPVTPAVKDSLTVGLNISSVTKGFHNLCLRARDQYGYWSVTQVKSFYKESMGVDDANITKLEYFIDTDPGFGKAKNIPVTPSHKDSLTYSIDLSSIASGLHYLCIRAMNQNGSWGIMQSQAFYKESSKGIISNISKLEYFIDTDPGFGKGVNIPITPGINIDVQFLPDLTCYADSVHTIYIRVMDSTGVWSLVSMDTVMVPPAKSPDLAATGDTIFCLGGPAPLKVTSMPGVDYQWKVDGRIITGTHDSLYNPIESGAYKAVLNHNNVCSDSTGIIHIIVNPVYNLSETIYKCGGEMDTLPDGRIVATPGTFTSNLLTYQGCDSIIVTNLVVKISGCGSGIKTTDNIGNIEIYPNPSESIITIESPEPVTMFEVMDLAGRLILVNNIDHSVKTVVDLSGLKSGVYIIKVFTTDRSNTPVIRQIIKQ
jgi:hypothetical protein